jgi:hypothetical protein
VFEKEPINLLDMPVYILDTIFERMDRDQIVLTCYTNKELMQKCMKSSYKYLLEEEKDYRQKFVDKFGLDKLQAGITWRKQFEDFKDGQWNYKEDPERRNADHPILIILENDYDDLIEYFLPEDINIEYFYKMKTILGKALDENATKTAKKLVELGANTTGYTGYNLPPLLIAIVKGNDELVELFLKRGHLENVPQVHHFLLQFCVYGKNDKVDKVRLQKCKNIAKLLKQYNLIPDLDSRYSNFKDEFYIFYLDRDNYLQRLLNRELVIDPAVLDELLGEGYNMEQFLIPNENWLQRRYGIVDLFTISQKFNFDNIFNRLLDRYIERADEAEEKSDESADEESVESYDDSEEDLERDYELDYEDIRMLYETTDDPEVFKKLIKYVDFDHLYETKNKEFVKYLIDQGHEDVNATALYREKRNPELFQLLLENNNYSIDSILDILEDNEDNTVNLILYNYFKEMDIDDYNESLIEVISTNNEKTPSFVKVLLKKNRYEKDFIDLLIYNINKAIECQESAGDNWYTPDCANKLINYKIYYVNEDKLNEIKDLLREYLDENYAQKIRLEPVSLKPVSEKKVLRQWGEICNAPEREEELGKLDKMELMWLATEFGIADMVHKNMTKEQLCGVLNRYAEAIKQ